MRVWLDPQQLKARGLTTQDVVAAIQRAERAGRRRPDRPAAGAGHADVPVHRHHARPARATSSSSRTSSSRPTASRVTRLRDVARVELGGQVYDIFFQKNGKPAAGIAVFQLPGANALDVADQVRAVDGAA